jgi:hypothetical protein
MNKLSLVGYLSLILAISSCSKSQGPPTLSIAPEPMPSVGISGANFTVRARATFTVQTSPTNSSSQNAQSRNLLKVSRQSLDFSDITVTNAQSVQFELNKALVQGNQDGNNNLLSFGQLSIQTLFDNDLICGGIYHCLQGQIRAYTIGPNSGLYSPTINQSVPIYVTTSEYPAQQNLGVGESQSVILEDYNIASNVNVLTQANFILDQYQLFANFTQAGAASDYSATVVVEYVLTGNGPAVLAASTSDSKNKVSAGGGVATGNGFVVNAGISSVAAPTNQTASDGSLIIKAGIN